MDYRVIFKDTFLTDLERIIRLIAVQNPAGARKLGDLIIQTGESLCFFQSVTQKSVNALE